MEKLPLGRKILTDEELLGTSLEEDMELLLHGDLGLLAGLGGLGSLLGGLLHVGLLDSHHLLGCFLDHLCACVRLLGLNK